MQLQNDKLVKETVKWKPNWTRKHTRPNITRYNGVRINMEKRKINDDDWLDKDMWKREVLGL
jgi:hypothetical protein